MNRLCAYGMAAAVGVLAAGGTARAGDPPTDEKREKPAAPVDPLAGPSATGGEGKKEAKARATLVERDFDGKVKRLEALPVVAAVERLDLDEATREKVRGVIARHNAAMDGVVRDNLRLIVELAGANQAGRKEEAGRLLREVYAAAAPLRELGLLPRLIQDALPEGSRRELMRLTREYWEAILEEGEAAGSGEMKEEAGVGAAARAAKVRRAEMLAAAGGEIRRAYERVVGQRAAEFEALLAELRLSPEQESKVRKVVGDSFQKTYGKASEAEKARVFMEVWRVLEEEQRAIVLKRLRE